MMAGLPTSFWIGTAVGGVVLLAIIGLYYLLLVLPHLDRGDD